MKAVLLLSVLYLSTIQVWGVTRCTTTNLCQNTRIRDNRINCIDDDSCLRSTLTATDSITCKGRESCRQNGGLTATNEIICSGYESCYQAKGNITSISGDVSCLNGYSCCLGINKPTVPKYIFARNVKCFGNRACMHQTIFATGDVRLAGYLTAQRDTSVTAQGDITVVDRGSDYTYVSQATLTATNIVVTGGYIQRGALTVSNSVLCKADYGCVASDISPSGNTLSVEFAGSNSGYGASVYCPFSGDCTIKCSNGGVGCKANDTARGWGVTIVYFAKTTNLNVIPKICGPNYPTRDINTCPEFRRQKNSEEEYNEMIMELIAEKQGEEEEYDEIYAYAGEHDDIEEMLFEAENENDLLSGPSSSYLNMNMVNGLIIFGFIGMIIGGLIIYYHCYVKANKYEIIQ